MRAIAKQWFEVGLKYETTADNGKLGAMQAYCNRLKKQLGMSGTQDGPTAKSV